MPGAAASVRSQVSEFLSWYRGKVRWRLSARGGIVLASYALVVYSIAGGILAVELWQPHHDWWVAATAAGHLVQATATTAASLCYISVSRRAERSTQLHAHGLVLILMLTAVPGYLASEALLFRDECGPGAVLVATSIFLWALQKAVLFMLISKKTKVLGPMKLWCIEATRWGKALAISAILVSVAAVGLYSWGALLIARGFSCDEVLHASGTDLLSSDLSAVDKAVMLFFVFMSSVGATGVYAAGSAMMVAANRLRRRTVSRLAARQVKGEELSKVQRTLGQHLLGAVMCITSTQLIMAAGLLDGLNIFGDNESLENFVVMLVALVDVLGDIAGILLLSGIAVLLVHEDPEAGDMTCRIRSLLHSAVLTSRAELVFEGHVEPSVRSRLCVASFPGKFLGDWHSLTWACEQGKLCSACVFLPTADPQVRFGNHAPHPEAPDQCWCTALYGEQKPWGCMWFQAWKNNVERAAELDLELVAVYFPGQTGKGKVKWSDLGTADLWDGVGLGGSQKSEVAYMTHRGFQVTEMDMEEFRRRVNQMVSSSHIGRN